MRTFLERLIYTIREWWYRLTDVRCDGGEGMTNIYWDDGWAFIDDEQESEQEERWRKQ